MTSLDDLVTRRSRAFLLGTCVASVVVGVAAQLLRDTAGLILVAAALLASLSLVVYGMLTGARRDGPSTVLVPGDGPSFMTPVIPLNVLTAAAAMVLWLGFLLPENIAAVIRGDGTWWEELPVSLIVLLFLAFFCWRTLVAARTRLLPAGVEYRAARGPVLVPWEEIQPADVTVVNRLGVRGVVLGRQAFMLVSAKPGRLASIIRQYAADPGHRSAIGTAPELARLFAPDA